MSSFVKAFKGPLALQGVIEHYADGIANDCDSYHLYDGIDDVFLSSVHPKIPAQHLDVVTQFVLPGNFKDFADIAFSSVFFVLGSAFLGFVEVVDSLGVPQTVGFPVSISPASRVIVDITKDSLTGTFLPNTTIYVRVRASGGFGDIGYVDDLVAHILL